MTESDQRELFWRIGASGKNTPEAKRAGCIGTFGIGGFANFGVCERLVVTSKREGYRPCFLVDDMVDSRWTMGRQWKTHIVSLICHRQDIPRLFHQGDQGDTRYEGSRFRQNRDNSGTPFQKQPLVMWRRHT
ncbi:hypothetical protein ES703_102484 [subsurface metagenome]